jgi:hypothetical protein
MPKRQLAHFLVEQSTKEPERPKIAGITTSLPERWARFRILNDMRAKRVLRKEKVYDDAGKSLRRLARSLMKARAVEALRSPSSHAATSLLSASIRLAQIRAVPMAV